MTYTIRYNASTNHIEGTAPKTQSTGTETGGVVAYFAENACGALTRGRFAQGTSRETAAEILAAAKASPRKLCKRCEAATVAAAEAE